MMSTAIVRSRWELGNRITARERKVSIMKSCSLSDAVIATVMGSIEQLGRPFAAFYTAGGSEVHVLTNVAVLCRKQTCSVSYFYCVRAFDFLPTNVEYMRHELV